MDVRASTLAIRLCTPAAAVISLDGCWLGDGWEDSTPIELGTDADLHAVIELSDWLDDRQYTHAAVGSEGAVIAWGYDYSGPDFVERFSVGEADLRAFQSNWSGWWVVGDQGMVAVSSDLGQNWTTVDFDTTANLHAITLFEDEAAIADENGRVPWSLVVVGDDVVFVQATDGTWSEIPAPAGSWGQLHAVDNYDGWTYAVGLDGVIWSTQDPTDHWIHETSGVDADLFDICVYVSDLSKPIQVATVGAGGTMLLGRAGGWTRANTGVSVDLIGCDSGGVLAADGQVFEFGAKPLLNPVETFPGAKALAYSYLSDIVVVGDDGMAREKGF